MIILVTDNSASTYACRVLAAEIIGSGRNCVVVSTKKNPNTHTPYPVHSSTKNGVVLYMSTESLLNSPLILNAQAIGVFLSSKQAKTFIVDYKNIILAYGRKPVPVFSGPVFPLYGDQLARDVVNRLGADIICLHGQYHVSAVRELISFWRDPLPVIEMGLWFMPESPDEGCLINNRQSSQPTLLFLAQEHFPAGHSAKERLLKNISQLAHRSPTWKVVILADYDLGSTQLPLGAEKIKWKWAKNLPDNLSFGIPESLYKSLSFCHACLTVSSPWIFPAYAWGKKAIVLGDYGISTKLDGPLFFGSGTMYSLEQITELDQIHDFALVNDRWLDNMGWSTQEGISNLLETIDTLIV